MKTKNDILNCITEKEEKLFIANVYDKLETSMQKSYPIYTDFLDSAQMSQIKSLFSFMKDELLFVSNIHDSQRQVLCLNFDYICCPTKILEINNVDSSIISHRDVLGALMNLGIKRQKIGDILVYDKCFFEVKEEVSDFIITNLLKIRHTNVDVKICEDCENICRVQEFSESFLTVSSLRADCIISAILNFSREKSKEYILNGNFNLNHVTQLDYSKTISEGDTLSLKKFGRYIFEKSDGITKKNRFKIVIKKYL